LAVHPPVVPVDAMSPVGARAFTLALLATLGGFDRSTRSRIGAVTTTAAVDRLRPLRRTRQVREFTEQPVDPAELAAIADVARWTGSSRNTQPWRFIVLTDVDAIRRIAEIGPPQTRSLRTATAAIAIVLPADDSHEVGLAYDDGRVAERILIAAGMLDLAGGIAWVRPDVREAIGGVLGLPADRYVRTIVALGHPTDAALAPKSAPGEARLPRDETVYEERWPG
jgi:nitroreductase